MTVRVKICGITRPEDAEAAITLGADFIGLNFYPPSPRALERETARRVRDAIGNHCAVVGVFVNAERSHVEACRQTLQLDFIQFHGDEADEALSGWPVPVIRALRLRTEDRLTSIARGTADYALIDAFTPGIYGGTGRRLALDRIAGADLSRVFVAGGLSPDNVGAAVALKPFAVDVAGGVESAPGIKDHDKLRSFIANAKSAR